MKSGLVSIITPTFNSEKYILETIQSVKNQTYTDWEMLIVDDCSTDATFSIVKEQAEIDFRIKVYKLDKNSGAGVARNKGISIAQGQYITFIDADDIWFNDFISSSILKINTSRIPFVYSSYKRANENLEFIYSDFIVPKKVTYSDILKSNSISCLTAFIDISVLGKKYMPLIKKRQDMGLWLQYLKTISFAEGIIEPKAIYRIRANSLSRNKTGLIKYQWSFYRNVEKLSITESLYYLINWMYYGYLKYK